LDPSDVDDLLRRAEHNQVSGRTMSFNEKVLGNTIAVQKGHRASSTAVRADNGPAKERCSGAWLCGL